ncbi:hypothetical protein UFOVP203_35 [uncultured Caudovirales phage]|uniref:Uncharacterized protein n=1 Tax=uncultured Caudovirales phage TaxID=2100421 RepID=A0A6J7WJH5_9CAUD|nr:hypothetical protein UFOVP203_35 [uncultured Caudovirales phage]
MEQKLVFRVSAEFQELKNAFSGIKEDFKSVGDEVKKIEDKFTKSWTKMESNMKLFGETSENVKGKMNALKASMVDLVSQGISPADARIVKMKSDYDALAASMSNTEGIRKANIGWTNLALVIQDLPFGFRGIQNNLPALFGSIAAAGGIAYVAFSAIVALYTAYGQQINDLILRTTNFEKSQQALRDGTIEAAKSTIDARVEFMKVNAVIQAASKGYINEAVAVKYFNDKVGDSIGKVSTLGEAQQALTDKTPKYIEAIKLKAQAEYYYAQAAKYAVEGDIVNLKDQTSLLDKLLAGMTAFADVRIGPKAIIGAFIGSLSQAQKSVVDKVKAQGIEIGKVLEKSGDESMTKYFAALKAAGATDKELAEIAEKLNKAREAANAKAAKLALKDEKDTQQHLDKIKQYESDAALQLYNEKDRELREVTDKYRKEIDLAVEYGQDTTVLEEGWRAELASVRKKWDDKDLKEAEDKNNKLLAESKRAADRDLQNQLDSINITAELKAKLAKKGPSATKAAYQSEIDALYELASVGGYTADQYDKIDDAIVRVQAKMAALDVGALKGAEAMQKVNSVISDMAVNSVVLLAESLGKLLGGENVDLFAGFVGIMGSGLEEIGKALITYGLAMEAFKNAFTNPFAAIAAGVALVAAGALLKSKISNTNQGGSNVQTFANGGIISGPTYGLMGEYPGASSNPEVVAPLDKLKDMIGGGGNQGGTFVLRGQDLLLSVNRAQKASNLKGQTISLA